jgi:hypothetical protein
MMLIAVRLMFGTISRSSLMLDLEKQSSEMLMFCMGFFRVSEALLLPYHGSILTQMVVPRLFPW